MYESGREVLVDEYSKVPDEEDKSAILFVREHANPAAVINNISRHLIL